MKIDEESAARDNKCTVENAQARSHCAALADAKPKALAACLITRGAGVTVCLHSNITALTV